MNQLSEREKQVLVCLCKGMFFKEGAFSLGIAENTFRQHAQNIKYKLGAHSLAQATALYVSVFGMPA